MGSIKGLEECSSEIDELLRENEIKLEDYDLNKIIERIKQKGIFN